ncbi:MAG: NADH:flavin oxidoreductase, partial [Pseudomonadota bacterium]
MWRPPERIKHVATTGEWPNRAAAQSSKLFQPLSAGNLYLEDRTWVPAMVPWRASEDGYVTENVLDWYRRFAEGQPGAIVVEATGIRDIPSGPLLRIGDDRFLPGLQALVNTVKDASGGYTKLFIQVIDFLSIRRRPDPKRFLEQFLTVTPDHRRALGMDESTSQVEVREKLLALEPDQLEDVLNPRELEALRFGHRERVTDTQLPHIADLPEKLPGLFASAAVRAEQAGFDGVELHYAHAYTMASFLSATNTREDGYGGDKEQRVRLPLEVFNKVKSVVSDDFVVGCRMLTEDCVDGGSMVEDAAFFAQALGKAGMDFISLSRGGKFDDAKQPKVGQAVYPYTGPSGYECMPSYYSDEQGPFGRNLGPAKRVRDALSRAGLPTPTVAVGGIHNFEQAEQVLTQGEGDVVGLA